MGGVTGAVLGGTGYVSLVDEPETIGLPSSVPEQISLDFLYRRYAQALTNFCRGRLGDYESEAEDACHDALLKAYDALSRFRQGPLWPWLATIAANVCIDIQRKRSRMVGLNGNLGARAVPEPDIEAARRIREQIVRRAIGTLPERYRTLIHQRDFEGWSYRELALLHCVKVPAVATSLSRARRALKKAIEKLARAEGQWPLPVLIMFPRRVWRRSSPLFESAVSTNVFPLLKLVVTALLVLAPLVPVSGSVPVVDDLPAAAVWVAAESSAASSNITEPSPDAAPAASERPRRRRAATWRSAPGHLSSQVANGVQTLDSVRAEAESIQIGPQVEGTIEYVSGAVPPLASSRRHERL